MCLIVQLCAYVPWTLAFVAPLMLYMGLCSYVVAHATDLKTIFVKLDDQVLLNKYASKRKTSRAIDPNSILKEILKEAVDSHRDLIKYDTDLNLFILNDFFPNIYGMNSFCCQQIIGEYAKNRVRLFILSIYIYTQLYCILYICDGRCFVNGWHRF